MPKIEPVSSTTEVLTTLGWVRKSGYKPVALRPQSKAPASEGYNNKDYNPPSDDFWKRGNYGIGVATGPMHNGPVDLDLDCSEAIAISPLFFPATDAVFGRKSKPRSHLLYALSNPPPEGFRMQRFLDPIGKDCILEVRGDGHQTVFPGSIHETTGEMVEWQGNHLFPVVTQIALEDLIEAAQVTAIATLICRYLWVEGSRHLTAGYLSGMLCRAEWTQDKVERLIEAVCHYTGDTERSDRIRAVRDTYRKYENDNNVTGAPTLRRQFPDVVAVIDRINEWSGSSSSSFIFDFNDRWAKLLAGVKFRIVDLSTPPGSALRFMEKGDFVNYTVDDKVQVIDPRTGEPKKVSKSKLWLEHPRATKYHDVVFLPGVYSNLEGDTCDPRLIRQHGEDTHRLLNLWTGWGIMPKEGDCSAWLRLLREVHCGGNEELDRWARCWFAHILRDPLVKPMTSPVFISPPGAGKTLLFNYFGLILGDYYVQVTDEEHLTGRFNSHMSMALLVHSDEATYAKDKRHAGKIRSLITDRYTMHEPKFADAKRIESFHRIGFGSNELDTVDIQSGDRRYTIYMAEERKMQNDHKEQLLGEMYGDGPAALHHYFLNMPDYDPMLVHTNIKNNKWTELNRQNMDPLAQFWLERLELGQILPDYLGWAQHPNQDDTADVADNSDLDWPRVVSRTALMASYHHYCAEKRVRYHSTDQNFKAQFEKMVGDGLVSARLRFYRPDAWLEDPNLIRTIPNYAVQLPSGRHTAFINFPTLAECRAAFDRFCREGIAGRTKLRESENVDDSPPPKKSKPEF